MSWTKIDQRFNIDRRTFMIGGAASAALLSTQFPASAEPKRGGVLRLGLSGGGNSDSLDTMFATGSFSQVRSFVLNGYLTEIDRKKGLIPNLAESWHLSTDGLQWTFKLRRDVTFSNGKTVEAEDVIFSLNRHRGPGTKSTGATYLRPIKDIRANSKYEIVFTSESVFLELPTSLASNRFAIFPAGWEDFNKPVSCGPYALERFEPGVRLSAFRNANYFRNDRAWFDGVELYLINDQTAKLNALLTNRVDAINRINTRTANLLRQNNAVDLVQASGGQHYVFYMDCNVPEFANENVRLAMKYAIDREAILKNAINGYGTIGNDHPISKDDPFFNPNIEQYGFDPDKAKFYLRKSGLSNIKVPLSVSDGAWNGAVDAAVSYSENAAKAGIQIDVVREPANGYLANVYKKRPFFASYWQGEPTATELFDQGYHSSAADNAGNWKSPEMDDLLKKVRAERNDDKRREIVWKMQEVVHNDGSVIVPVFADFLDAKSKKVQGFEPSTYREMDGYRIAERAWFA